MKNKIPFLLLTLLSFVVGCTQYSPFEKNNWGKQELHGKVKTLKSTVYDYNYDDDGVLEEIDTIVEICHFNEKGFNFRRWKKHIFLSKRRNYAAFFYF